MLMRVFAGCAGHFVGFVVCRLILHDCMFYKLLVFYANSVDPDQTLFSPMSGLNFVCQGPYHWTLGINGLRQARNGLSCMEENIEFKCIDDI